MEKGKREVKLLIKVGCCTKQPKLQMKIKYFNLTTICLDFSQQMKGHMKRAAYVYYKVANYNKHLNYIYNRVMLSAGFFGGEG